VSRPLALAACGLLALLAVLAVGCGGSDDEGDETPQLILEQAGGDEEPPGDAPPPTFPNTATVNTVRVAGRNAIEDAAGVASAVFPATDEETRPAAVALVDQDDWQAGVAASVLAYGEIGAPILLTDGDDIPAPTAGTLSRLDPTGAELADNAQVIAVGEGVPSVEDRRTSEIAGADPFELAAEIDSFSAAAEGRASENVVIASAEEPAWAMPAAAWAARSGDSVLFTEPDALPEATRAALEDHENPDIYVLGPESVVSAEVEEELGDLGGSVERVEGATPVENAIEFARYTSGSFGWGLVTPGHNFTLVSDSRPADAGAAAALAASGTYAPLLLTDSVDELPGALRNYFLDIQPGFEDNPNSGVYNRVWILGDQSTVSLSVQAAVDELTELIPVQIDEEPPDEPERDAPAQPDRRDGGGGSDEDIPENLPDAPPDDDVPGPGGIPAPQGPGLPGDDV
jgi:ell wall binding domain 2 (CWB2)